MRVAYLLPDTPLFGGIKVPLSQAELLAGRGHEIVVAAPGPRPDWFPLTIEYRALSGLADVELPGFDLVVATFWTTIGPALAATTGPVAQYCQGLEYGYTHNQEEHPAILEAYRQRLPALCVSAHLATEIETRFGRPARVVPQPLEPYWFARPRRGPRPPRAPFRIVVLSPFEIDWKGVETALRAVSLLRERGLAIELIRISQWPESGSEAAIARIDRFLTRLAPPRVASILATADLLLAPSWEQEGFGLPALEAMARGVPVVASDVAAYRSWAASAAILVPPRDAAALANAAAALLTSPYRWWRQRRRGRALAWRRYRPQTTTRAAELALVWAASLGR